MSKVIDPDVIAYVRFLTPDEGGWSFPMPSTFLGCFFFVNNEYFSCRLYLSEVGPLSLGDSAEVPIKFLYPDYVMPLLSEGTHFKLRTLQTIAVGHVLRVVGQRSSPTKPER